MLRLSSGLPRQAGSANRLSPLAGATSELPCAIDSSSRPSVAARDSTTPGLRARFNANLLHDVLGIIRSAIPTAELVNSRSSGAANSSAPSILVATTLSCLLECRLPNLAAQRLDTSAASFTLLSSRPLRLPSLSCSTKSVRVSCTSEHGSGRTQREPSAPARRHQPVHTVRRYTIPPPGLSAQTT